MSRYLFSQIAAQMYCFINTDKSISLSIDAGLYFVNIKVVLADSKFI